MPTTDQQFVARVTQWRKEMPSSFKETPCNDPDCTFPACNCWENKRKTCPSRIPKLEKALQLAKYMILANGLDLPETMTVINEALRD